MTPLREIREQVAGGEPSRALEAIGAWRSSLLGHIARADGELARSERAIKFVQNL